MGQWLGRSSVPAGCCTGYRERETLAINSLLSMSFSIGAQVWVGSSTEQFARTTATKNQNSLAIGIDVAGLVE